jgi:hypothetical protein
MPFEPLTHTKLNKKTGLPISNNTVKVYKTLLNRLAEQGYDTKEKLISEQRPVIRYIDSVIGNDSDSSRQLKRQYLSAIFFALEEYALDSKQQYYDVFQTSKQNYGSEAKPKPRNIESSLESSLFEVDGLPIEFIRVDKEGGTIVVVGILVKESERNHSLLALNLFKGNNDKRTIPSKKNKYADPVRGEPGIKAYWITRAEAKELITEKENNETK